MMSTSHARVRVSVLLLACLPCAALTCDKEPELEWQRFNHEADDLDVYVTAKDFVGGPASIDLHSTTGATVVGAATVDPAAGPIGTDHELRVAIGAAWSTRIGRVSVFAGTKDRGVREVDLTQDSADLGLWVTSLTSWGDSGEERDDVWEIALWELVEVVEEPEVATEPGGSE